jgi:dTMP kinase
MDGKLIVFEGVEGSGKTTQIRKCQEWLQNCDRLGGASVVVTREPGGTELGVGLRRLLLEGHRDLIRDRAELFLYASDRSQHVEEVLKPQLAKGAMILCDRYTDSTVAYQAYGRGLSLSLINQLNQLATDGLESDLTLWLDIEVEIGLERARQRGAVDRMEQADLAFHRRVQQGYQELAAAYPQRIVRVNASRSQEEVQAQIQQILLEQFADGEQRKLKAMTNDQ